MFLANRTTTKLVGYGTMLMCIVSLSACLEATDAVAPPSSASPTASSASPTGSTGASVSQTTTDAAQLFNNRLLQFDTSSGNKANDAFESRSTQLEFCPGNRFGMIQSSFFSSSAGGFSSEYSYRGSWKVSEQAGVYQVALDIEETDEEDASLTRELTVEAASTGEIFVDGAPATVKDVTEDCASI